MGREKCLEDALQLLLKFQLATRVDASFDEQIIADYVDLPIEEFRRLTPHKTAFHEQLEHIQRRLHRHRDTAMPLCLVHGDYEFVNILKPDSGDLCLLDWESATLRGPGLMDLAHLLIAYAVHAMDMNYDQAARALYLRDGDLYAFASRYLSEYEQRFELSRSLRPAFLAMNIVGGLSRLLSRLPFKASDPLWSAALLTARDILDEADSSATQDTAEPTGSV
jgi:thiamine kinase-like enzyme